MKLTWEGGWTSCDVCINVTPGPHTWFACENRGQPRCLIPSSHVPTAKKTSSDFVASIHNAIQIQDTVMALRLTLPDAC